jgi:hypothetical protein
MRLRTLPVCLAATFLIVLLVPSLSADWTEGGTEICTNPDNQNNQEIISDGAGGAIVVWMDEREGAFTRDVYAQRLDSEGNILWDARGVNVSERSMSQWAPVLVSDGNGGAIIAYINDRAGNYDITAQRVLPDGSMAWPTGGITICGASYDQTDICIVSDDVGGAIIAWSDYRSNVSWDIYAARIASSGSLYWTNNGVAEQRAGPRRLQHLSRIRSDIRTFAGQQDRDDVRHSRSGRRLVLGFGLLLQGRRRRHPRQRERVCVALRRPGDR